MKKANIQINRKMLAQLAVLDIASFNKVVQLASQAGK
jgi:large subunit ribosomal protein L20